MPQVITIPFEGQEIGQGYNSETRENIGTGLQVANISEDKAADGQIVTTSFVSVTSQESLLDALGISASADVRFGLFSSGGKFSFAQSSAVNSFSSFIAGRCVEQNAITHGHGFTLNDDARPLVAQERMDEFKTAFGDKFVRALKTGGEFDVVARITSISEDHQTRITATLHAAYNGLATAADFQSTFDKAMHETNSQTEVTVFVHQEGGQESNLAFTGSDAVKVLDKLSQMPTFVHQHPIAYEAELADYDTIPLPIPTAEESEDRELVLQDCFQQKMKFLKALSDLSLLLGDNANLFFDQLPPKADLLAIEEKYRTALNQLMAHAIKVSTGAMKPRSCSSQTRPRRRCCSRKSRSAPIRI
jgi:hypothetical protein